METIGFILVFGGVLLIRQVAIGRAGDTKDDLTGIITAALQGDYAKVKSIASQAPTASVDGEAAGAGAGAAVGSATGYENSSSVAVLNEMQRLGAAATGYEIGATGPQYYDCSGLVWRSMRNVGYNVSRFTTTSFPTIGRKYGVQIPVAELGCVVVWPPAGEAFGHMGCCSGDDQLYSALNTKQGIVTSKLTGIHPGTPTFWRLTPPVAATGTTGKGTGTVTV